MGDSESQTLTIQNTAIADGFSEKLNASFGSSSGVTCGKRGSCMPAETALQMISSARLRRPGAKVPMQPRNRPSFLMETKQPARLSCNSSGSSFGTGIMT